MSLSDKNIKYIELSTNDFGGAGHAALKSVEELRKKGIDAKLIVWNKKSNEDFVIGIYNSNNYLDRVILFFFHVVSKLLKKMAFGTPNDRKYIYFDIQKGFVSAKKILKLYGDVPDVITVGWVTDFVTTKTVYDLKEMTGAKVVYFMTDDAPITGGCHYPWDCKGYTYNCYPCPALKKGCKCAQKTLLFKHRFITSDMVISGTTNDANRAKKSLLFRNSVIIRSATLNPNPYHFNRIVIRDKWGIDNSKYVIFCGASSVNDKRKGFSHLVEALSIFKNKEGDVSRVLILVAGDGKIDFPRGYEVKSLGKLDFKDLFKAYACSDLFVCPSVEDSGPMMINYAVMAYIPVVAFEMGIALDIVLHKENGYIAKWSDSTDFAEGISYCYHHEYKYNREKLEKINNYLADEIKKNRTFWNYFYDIIIPSVNIKDRRECQ